MQEATIGRKWGVVAALLAVFALAFTLMATESAFADDLTAGDAELSMQNSMSDWPLKVCIQYGSGSKQVIAQYTKDEITEMAGKNKGMTSGISYAGESTYKVTTATSYSYVTLQALLADAGVQWGQGASVTYTGKGGSQTLTYDQVNGAYFYPKAPADKQTGKVKTDLVFGLDNAREVAIGEGYTAGDVQKQASTASRTDQALLAIVGTTESDLKTLSGPTISSDRFVAGVNEIVITYPDTTVEMFRLYNPNSGEHFYTSTVKERDELVKVGWTYEGVGWTAPIISNLPVYRMYNPNAGDHHYTLTAKERDELVKVGWKYEGIGWYSDVNKGVPLYRQYNPNAKAGAHNYTTSKAENDYLVSIGWKAEGIGWYGVKK